MYQVVFVVDNWGYWSGSLVDDVICYVDFFFVCLLFDVYRVVGLVDNVGFLILFF